MSDDGIDKVLVHPTTNGPVLDGRFFPEGAARLVEGTKGGVGRQLGVLVNSRVVAAALIVEPLPTGRRVQIGLDLPKDSANAASIAAR